MLTLLSQSLCAHFLRVNVHCEILGYCYINNRYRGWMLVSVDIYVRNPDLLALLPEVEN